jgi:hypothetical protein
MTEYIPYKGMMQSKNFHSCQSKSRNSFTNSPWISYLEESTSMVLPLPSSMLKIITAFRKESRCLGSGGFEPSKAEPTDLQASSALFYPYIRYYIICRDLSIFILIYRYFPISCPITYSVLPCQKMQKIISKKSYYLFYLVSQQKNSVGAYIGTLPILLLL